MLKLVGTGKNGAVEDERVLIDNNDRPTAFLLGLAALELTFDFVVACVLANTVFKRK